MFALFTDMPSNAQIVYDAQCFFRAPPFNEWILLCLKAPSFHVAQKLGNGIHGHELKCDKSKALA